MNVNRFFGAILLVASLNGCAGLEERGPQVGRPLATRSVFVENWTSSDLRIYAFYGGDVTLLGSVTAMNNAVMKLPSTYFGSIQFLAFLRGATSVDPYHVSDEVHLFEGQRVNWMIRATGGSSLTLSL